MYQNYRNIPVPKAVMHQIELRRKYHYKYKELPNGNVENNSTLYVNTSVAHPYQIEELFANVVKRAKNMPEVFGKDFECDFQVNVVRRFNGTYLGYAFVDVTNPKLYYALIGCNVDGSDRALYIDDPTWKPPPVTSEEKTSWADDEVPTPPKIRKELKPLLHLDDYKYDEQQQTHLKTGETHGSVSISPAFISPGINKEFDDCSLYVSDVPAIDYDFLYALFSRYARFNTEVKYPRITIRRSKNVKDNRPIFAIVQYGHHYDTAFAFLMLQKIRAKYNDVDISMPVRYAYLKNKE